MAAVRYKRALVDQGGAEPRIPLSSALKNFGVAEGIKKNHGKAEEALQEAADRLRSLVDENGLESRELLADTLMNLGIALSEQEEPQRAENTYREAIKQFRALLEKRNVRRHRERLAEAYNKLGVEVASQEKYRESKQAAMAAAAQYQILFVERRATMKDRRWMAGAFRNFGKAARNLYYSDEEYDPRAERALRAAVDHYRAFFQKERTLQMRRELAETLDDLSKEHRLRSENEQAAESISEVASHFRVLFEKEEDLEVGKRLASALTSCGRTELLAKKFSEAENTLKAAADHIQSYEKFRMPERLALVWMTLGTAQFEQGKISEAEENLRKAVNLTGELPAPEPRVFQAKLLHPTHFSSYGESRWRGLSNLARCQVNKSKSEQSCGKSSEEHLQKAASYTGQAISEIEEQRREMKDFHQRRALRAEYDFLYEDRRDIAHRLGKTETSLRWTSGSKARGLSELIKASRSDE